MAKTVHIFIDKATDIVLEDSPDPDYTGSPIITGWTIRFSLALSAADADLALITKTVGSGITITSAALGEFEVVLSATDTNLAPGKYTYSITRTNAGSVSVLTKGFLTIEDVAGQ